MPPVRFAGMAEDPEPHRNTAPNISYESASIPANDNLSSEADPAIHAVRQAISIDEMPDHDRLKGLLRIEDGVRSLRTLPANRIGAKKWRPLRPPSLGRKRPTGHEPRVMKYSSAKGGFNMNFVRRSIALETHLRPQKEGVTSH